MKRLGDNELCAKIGAYTYILYTHIHLFTHTFRSINFR